MVIFQKLRLMVALYRREGLLHHAPIRSAARHMINAPHGIAE
jgi:hypothetical protein